MVGIVPWVSQRATAGGEAGVGGCVWGGGYVAALGRGGGSCETAELQGREEAREAQQTFTERPRM